MFNLTTTDEKKANIPAKMIDSEQVTMRLLAQYAVCMTHIGGVKINTYRSWYKIQHNVLQEIADTHGITMLKLLSVVSALSPRNKWHRNIKDAETCILAHTKGKGPEDVSCATFDSNKIKAFAILDTPDYDWHTFTEFFTAPKTLNFVHNLIDPSNPDYVTVDSWAIRHSLNLPINIKVSVTGAAYDKLAQCFKDASNQLNMLPCELQALLWCYVRELAGKGD